MNTRSDVISTGFVRNPFVEKQILDLAKDLGFSEQGVITAGMKETLRGECTMVEDVAEVVVFLTSFPANSLAGQFVVVSQGQGTCSSFSASPGDLARGEVATTITTLRENLDGFHGY